MNAPRPRRRFLRCRQGSVAVEFAFIAPVLIVIMAGIYEIGHAFQTLTAVNALASQYAITWADCTDNPVGACRTELGLYTPPAAIGNISPQLTASGVTLQMFQVSMSGTTPTVVYSYPSNASMTAAQIAAAENTLTSGQSGVVVTVNYTYTVSIFPTALAGIIPTSIPMSFTVAQLKA